MIRVLTNRSCTFLLIVFSLLSQEGHGTLQRRRCLLSYLTSLVGGWDALNGNVKARLQEVPQLDPMVKELDAVLIEGREIQGVQDVYRRQLRAR
jgi:hypothetical protein